MSHTTFIVHLQAHSVRSAQVESASEDGFESEEDDSVPSYPLEGKFIDEADRQK